MQTMILRAICLMFLQVALRFHVSSFFTGFYTGFQYCKVWLLIYGFLEGKGRATTKKKSVIGKICVADEDAGRHHSDTSSGNANTLKFIF